LTDGAKVARITGVQGSQFKINEQGISQLAAYFVASINGRRIDTSMFRDRESKWYYKFFPKWAIASIEVA
jgi:hypothetical protein